MSEQQALEFIRQRRHIHLAFRALVGLYDRRVFRYLCRLCGNEDDAEDLTQDAFISAYKHIKRFDPDRAGFFTWVCEIGERRWLTLHRQRQREQACYEDLERTCDLTVPGPEQEYRDRLDREWVWAVLSKCTHEEQMVGMIHGMERRSIKETARALSMTESQVRYHWVRMLQKTRILKYLVTPWGGPH
jgi:RNA polymerase sigma-70 factor (ECF subfamily)